MTLHNWQIQYISKLRTSQTEESIIAELRISRDLVDEAIRENPAFAKAVETASSGIGSGVLCREELDRIRTAQVSEQRTAGYFGMTVDQFRAAMKENPELGKINEMAPLKGQALIQVGQYEAAVTGDTDMLKWLGKNHLDQAEKTETKVTVEEITDPRELAKRMAFLNAKAGLIIEGHAVEVSDTALLPDTDEDTIKPDGTLLLQSE